MLRVAQVITDLVYVLAVKGMGRRHPNWGTVQLNRRDKLPIGPGLGMASLAVLLI
jgi:hypothetical protein